MYLYPPVRSPQRMRGVVLLQGGHKITGTDRAVTCVITPYRFSERRPDLIIL